MIAFTRFPTERLHRTDLVLRDAYPLVPLCTFGVGSDAGRSSWNGISPVSVRLEAGLTVDSRSMQEERKGMQERDVRVAQKQKQQGAGIVKGGSVS